MSGTPTEFVRFNNNGKFEVTNQALQLLRALNGPVAVVAVAGRARQGKSFLLNQLVAKLGGSSAGGGKFQVSAAYKPCTKGLWLWSQAVQRKTADGQPYHIVS